MPEYAKGKVTIGFSYPFIATYNNNNGVISFTEGEQLARGVSVSLDITVSSDNDFYADNQIAETDSGVFESGSATLTVDGLFKKAKEHIYGLPKADTDGWSAYGDSMNKPYIGVGFIVKYMSNGNIIYTPTVLPKTSFDLENTSAETQTDTISWQTQELNTKILRGDDANHSWKYEGADYETETEALDALKKYLNISEVSEGA